MIEAIGLPHPHLKESGFPDLMVIGGLHALTPPTETMTSRWLDIAIASAMIAS